MASNPLSTAHQLILDIIISYDLHLIITQIRPGFTYIYLKGPSASFYGGGGCYGGSSNPKSQIILPLKSQIPIFLTPQIPNP